MSSSVKWFAAAGLLFAAAAGLARTNWRERAGDRPAPDVLFSALGAFRVFAADLIWDRMSSHLAAGRDGLVLAGARALLQLEPDSPEVRDFLHWHLAFNMAERAFGEAARAAWIEEAFGIVEEGLRRDPDSAVLNRGFGMTLFMVAGKEGAMRAVCRRRFGAEPEALAWTYFDKAFASAPETRTLLFLLQALDNAAELHRDRGEFGAAEALFARAEAAARGAAGLLDAAAAAELAADYSRRQEECRGAARAGGKGADGRR